MKKLLFILLLLINSSLLFSEQSDPFIKNIDSTSLNKSASFNALFGIDLGHRNFYIKVGDDLNWSSDTNLNNWTKVKNIFEDSILNDNGNIWYLFPINVSEELLNQPLCFKYNGAGAVEVFINGKKILQKGVVSTAKENEVVLNFNGFMYVTFKDKKNFILVRASNHSIEGVPFVGITLLNQNNHNNSINSDILSDNISLTLSIIYLVFSFVYFILFLSNKTHRVNLWFSIFCCFIFYFFVIELFYQNSENYDIHTFLATSKKIIISPLVFSFICFLQYLVFNTLKRYLKWLLLLCIVTFLSGIVYFLFIKSTIVISVFFIGVVVLLVFALIESIRIIYIGFKRKMSEIKPIIYGIFSSILLFLVLIALSLTSFRNFVGEQFQFILVSISLSAIPISASIALIKNYANTSKRLELELIKVSELSEKTILQEKEKQHILETQNEVLETQVKIRTEEVVKQKNIIEEHQKEIVDSITYAKRLQTAILPPDSYWKKYLPKSFVLYLPKNIVSGDFYWLESVNNLVLFAAADCTGHGVSGAMVSVVCSNALNRTINEFGITEPSKILDKTRELVLETFSKSESDIKDGMDISLCCLNTNNNELFWSGANNPLWYIRENNLYEIKGDKQPIGQNDNPKPFTTHKIELQKDDTIYIFTDGYADQFGGERGKKFMYKPLKELLLSIQNLTIQEQNEFLFENFINWKVDSEQTDDVLFIGFKI